MSLFKKVVIEYSNKNINREILSNHICDIIKQNEIEKEEKSEDEEKENRSVA